MHYHYNQREDAPFWKMCREMEIPESLRQRVELFRQGGHVYTRDGELFTVDSWISVMMGQHIEPRDLQPLRARRRPRAQGLHDASTARRWRRSINALPPHADFVKQYCGADESAWDFSRR